MYWKSGDGSLRHLCKTNEKAISLTTTDLVANRSIESALT
jgi:hypothetical protein